MEIPTTLNELDKLSPLQRFLLLVEEKVDRDKHHLIDTLYPDKGPLRRELYKKHTAFFRAGAKYNERCALSANRVGKSLGIGGYELVLHATGLYPDWWDGRRFKRPIRAWAAGNTGLTVRDIIQEILLGPPPPSNFGTGLIPRDLLVEKPRPKGHGVPEAVDTIYVRHKTGGVSRIGLKSYKEGRESFEGTAQDIIWLDEEPPKDVYSECVTRTMTTHGLILCTFTPLKGISAVVLMFLPGGDVKRISIDGTMVENIANRWAIMASWRDAPHLSEEEIKRMEASIPPYQLDARSKGIPALGSGRIYPIAEEEVVISDFEIPSYWPRVFSLDVGWKKTAALWMAVDREGDICYLYSEYYQGEKEPSIHANHIMSKGYWIPGVIDPAARGRSQIDGRRLMDIYNGLFDPNQTGKKKLTKAINAVDSGTQEVWQRLSSGRLKVFKSLNNWLAEFRLYRRNEKGQTVGDDHQMDNTRYLVSSGIEKAVTKAMAGVQKRSDHYQPADATVGY